MDKEVQFKRLFGLSSLITDVFPRRGARLLDFVVGNTLGNILVYKSVERQARKQFRKAASLSKILVAADLNIGDAVIAQASVSALREILPDARIDCVVKLAAGNLVRGNPDITNLFPLYVGAPFPAESDIAGLQKISSSENYDLVFNLSPMLDDSIFGEMNVVNYSTMAAQIIRNEIHRDGSVNNVVYRSYKFINDVFGRETAGKFRGAKIYLPESAVEEAGDFLAANKLSHERPIVMFNPDASAKFTRMPFEFQLNVLRGLAAADCSILLGAGHVEKLIEHELMYSLPPDHRKKITIIPSTTPLEVYAALVDASDVFISGDTGPLHVAAARKFVSSGEPLRNRTAILSVFGGTPYHVYGYDSERAGFLPANQNAPSKLFVGQNRCRNITCINKMAKTCKEVRCFRSLEPGQVVAEAARHLETARDVLDRERMRILVK